MRKIALIALLALLAACAREAPKAQQPLAVKGEKVYALRGKIVSRDARENSLKIDHEPIPGFMDAMTMDYTLRGAKVTSMPADKAPIIAKLHVADDNYWVTDVQAAGGARPSRP
jgi:hypothetical protein